MRYLSLLLLLCVFLEAARPPDWFKLPQAGEAPPVETSKWVLFDGITVTQDGPNSLRVRHRRAELMLSDAAVRTAVCSVPFTVGAEELVSARAWAMSPDGRKCRAFGGDEFLVYSPRVSDIQWDQGKNVMFDPERYLQTGWIFAWEVEIRSTMVGFDRRWSPALPWPARELRFEVQPMSGGEVVWRNFSQGLPQPEPMEGAGWRWVVRDVPGQQHQAPAQFSPARKDVRVYVLSRGAKAAGAKSWADVVQLVSAEMDPAMAATPEMEAEARRLAGTGDQWARIAPVCQFVQKDIVYLQITIDSDTMAGYRPHAASEVFKTRYGDCKDKAVLLCTMLKTLGCEARVVLVNAGEPNWNSADWPSAEFNHAIVAIRADDPPPEGSTTVEQGGKSYLLFDPTDPYTGFGLLPKSDALGLGLVLAPGVRAPVAIPAVGAPSETQSTATDIRLAADGSATISFVDTRAGLAGSAAIAAETLRGRSERNDDLAERIQSQLPMMSDLDWTSAPDPAHHAWSMKGTFRAQFVGRRLGKGLMYVVPDILAAAPQCSVWDPEAEGVVPWSPASYRHVARLPILEKWEVAEIPAPVETKLPAGSASVSYRTEAGAIVVESRLTIAGGLMDRARYLELRELLDAASSANHRPIVFRRIAAAASAGAAAPAPARGAP